MPTTIGQELIIVSPKLLVTAVIEINFFEMNIQSIIIIIVGLYFTAHPQESSPPRLTTLLPVVFFY